jgi:hypothetical protein
MGIRYEENAINAYKHFECFDVFVSFIFIGNHLNS